MQRLDTIRPTEQSKCLLNRPKSTKQSAKRRKTFIIRSLSHSFVVPVYRAAPGLSNLVDSLRAQTGLASEVILTTSTPTLELDTLARRYDLPIRVNPRRSDIAADWNFALAAAQTEFVTIAHQDDYFAPSYVNRLKEALLKHSNALFGFCDYVEHSRLGARRPLNANLWIKRALCRRAFGSHECITSTRDKMRLLSLGNPICCPSVMFNFSILPEFRFPVGLSTNLDWKAWLELARCPGGFVYVREELVSKGIHAASETTATIANRIRHLEDRALFEDLWPRPVAAALAALYKFAYWANRS
jgi:hypothetical protein